MAYNGSEQKPPEHDIYDVNDNGGDYERGTNQSIQERIRSLKNKQTAALLAVTKKRNEISHLMIDEGNLHLVKTAYAKFNVLCVAYHEAYYEHLEAIVIDPKQDNEAKRYEGKQVSIMEFRRQVLDWIWQAECHLVEEVESASHLSSKGSRSRRSNDGRSSKSAKTYLSVRSAQAKAKIAELMAAKELLRKQQLLKFEEENLRVEIELTKAKAQERALGEAAGNIRKEDRTDTDHHGQADSANSASRVTQHSAHSSNSVKDMEGVALPLPRSEDVGQLQQEQLPVPSNVP